mmetsp:Transcript_16725/g.36906  ORF Transcript_16725/g.36906 Transcript_16725/m.36906 type:complete len:283 (-) Transcript_16725:1206-2054(-)
MSRSSHRGPIWLLPKRFRKLLDRSRHKRKTPREEEKEHTTSGPHIATLAEISLPNLRCHVRWSSRHDITPVSGSSKDLCQTKVHHDNVHLRHRGVPGCGEHYVLRLKVLVDDSFGVTVSDGGQGVLHDLGHPELIGLGIHGFQTLHILCEITTAALLHHQVEVLLILKVLKYSENMRMVELFENCKLFPYLGFRCHRFFGLGLADHLANANPFGFVLVHLCPVRDQIYGTKRAFAQLFLDLVDFVKLLRICLNEILPPSLVAFLGAGANLSSGIHTDFLRGS